jgi:DNA-binding IscR family transcriptional regulator
MPASSIAARALAAAIRLARPAGAIKIGHVVRVIDGPLAPLPCASRTAFQPCRDCKNVDDCNVRLLMTEVRDSISKVLDRVTCSS